MIKKIASNKVSRWLKWILYPLGGVFIVFIFGSLLVLANGYLPEFKEGKVSFSKTGMIIIAAKPMEAKIYLNDRYKEKTAFYLLQNKLNNLRPGNYNVKIKKTGYRTWQKNITVEPGVVSWANYIIMFTEKLNIVNVSELTTNPITVSNNGRFLLYSGTKDNKFYATSYETSSLTTNSLWPSNTSASADWVKTPNILKASYNQSGNKVLYTIKNGDIKEYVVAEADGNDVRLTILNDQLHVVPTEINWDPYDDNAVFILVGTTLYHTKISADAVGKTISSDVISYSYESNKQVYYAKKSTINSTVSIEKSNIDGSDKTTIIDSIAPSTSYVFSRTPKNDTLAILSKDTGNLMLIYPANDGHNTTVRIGTGYKYISWQKDGKKLLYYDDTNVYRYDIEKNKSASFYYGKLESVVWYYDESHYLINGEHGLEIIEFDGGNPLVLTSEQVSLVVSENNNNNLLYAISKDSKLRYLRFISNY